MRPGLTTLPACRKRPACNGLRHSRYGDKPNFAQVGQESEP